MAGDIETTSVHTTHRHRDATWAAILADHNTDKFGPGREFATREAFIDWFIRVNHAHGHYGSGVDSCGRPWHGWLLDSTFIVPSDFNVDDIGCTPTPGPTRPPVVRNQPTPQPTPEPTRAPIAARDPLTMYPEHASPDDFNMLRAGYLAGVLPMDPPDAAARRQLNRRSSDGTWAGPGGGGLANVEDVPVGAYGAVGTLIGGPLGGAIGAVTGLIVRAVASDDDDTRFQRGAARQPYALILRGWKANPDGTFVRVNPGDNQDQGEWTHNTDGLLGWRLTLSDDDYARNMDSRTRARVTSALESPNAMAGIMSIRGLSNQVETEMAAFRADPHGPDARKHAQRVLDLTAAAARTDFAQASGLTDDYTRLQTDFVAEAGRANITDLRQYDMGNPSQIPNLADFPSGAVHPLQPRSYAEMCRDPGFPSNEISEAEYNERFVNGVSYDSVYYRAIGGQNESKRETALGLSRSPRDRAEVDQLTRDGIAVINTNAASRAAFVQSVRDDAKFGRIIGEEVNDWIQHPETHGFANREAAIAEANRVLGADIVQSEILGSATATPEDENPGRIRHDRIIANAFAANAGADDATVQRFLDHTVQYPQDPDTPQNVPGVAARAILTQIDQQGGTDGPRSHGPAFNAIAAAAGLDDAAKLRWAEQLKTLSNYNVDNDRGTRGRYTDNDAVRADTIADEGLSPGVTRRVVTGPEGDAAPVSPEVAAAQAAATQPLTNTGVRDVTDVQTAEVTQPGTPAGTLVATRAILADPGMRNVALESLAMYDRRMAAGLIVSSMANPANRHAFDRVIDNLRSGDNLPENLRGLDRSQRRLLTDCLKDAADVQRRLTEKLQRGEITPQQFAEQLQHGQRELNTYLRVIESQRGDTGNRILYQDEDGRLRAPKNMQEIREMADAFEAMDRARATGTVPEGTVRMVDEHGRVRTVTGSEAQRLAREAHDRGFATQYSQAVQGQDAIVGLMQMIGLDPDANAAMAGTVNQVQAGLTASQATRTLGSVQAAGPERTTGVGPSTEIRPDIGDIQNAQGSGDPRMDAALARARSTNAGAATVRDFRAYQAEPGAPVGDIITTIAFIVAAAIPGGGSTPPGNPEVPYTPFDPGNCCPLGVIPGG